MSFWHLLGVCLFVIHPNSGACEPLHLLEPVHVSLEYVNFDQGGVRDWYSPRLGIRDSYLSPLDEQITFGLQLNTDYNLLRWKKYKVFHRNNWGFDSAQSHVRHVWWRFDLGLNIYDKVEIFHQHMSRHVLEDTRDERFPVRDSFNIRLIIYEK